MGKKFDFSYQILYNTPVVIKKREWTTLEKYTVKQILFGLRNEFVENQKALQDLKKYIDMDREGIKYNIYYDINLEKKYYSLVFLVNEERNFIQRLLLALTSPSEAEYKIDDNSSLVFMDDKYPTKSIRPNIENTALLKECANNILKSRFVREMYVPSIVNEDVKHDLLISPNNISTGIFQGSALSPSSIYYRPTRDIIEITSFYDFFFKEDLNKILELEISEDKLNPYMIETINNHDVSKKEVEINGLKQVMDKQNFKIIEDEEKITLQRTM